MTKLREQVREFMAAFGQAMPDKPTWPSDDVVYLRARLIVEEALEFADACHVLRGDPKKLTDEILCDWSIDLDLADAADALADLDYVVEGTRLAFGIDGEPIAALVHASNMSKAGGPIDEHGKQRKPAGWQAPDVLGELRRQGWTT